MTSERDAGIPIWVLRVSAPFWRTASRADMPTMAKGLSWASQATVMAVKPALFATPEYRVLLAPETSRKPTTPAMAPERNMVRIMTQPTFMPA